MNQVLQCASKTANQFSIAGVLGLTGEGGGIGSTIGTAFLGNTFSGLVDTATHGYNFLSQGGAGASTLAGDLILGGARQGFPGGGGAAQGIAGVVTGAALDPITAPDITLSIAGAAAPLAEESLAGPLGLAKLAIDLTAFGASAAYWYSHP